MPAAVRPRLLLGKVYRTRDLARFSKNPSRMAKRLVAEGELRPLAHGIFVRPQQTKFGQAPPSREELMRAYLKGRRFVFSGPEQWNALSLGSTAMFASQLVYNESRSGKVTLGGRQFVLRRVAFPQNPTAEYFAVDLLKNHRQAGVSVGRIGNELARSVAEGRLSAGELRRNANRYGTKASARVVEHAIAAAMGTT